MIPSIAAARAADAVDVFCETIAFSPVQTRRVFACAREHGLPVKLHADQLSDQQGGDLAAEFDPLDRCAQRVGHHHQGSAERGAAEGGVGRRDVRVGRLAVVDPETVPKKLRQKFKAKRVELYKSVAGK